LEKEKKKLNYEEKLLWEKNYGQGKEKDPHPRKKSRGKRKEEGKRRKI